MFTIDTVSNFINGLLNKMDAVNKLPPLLLYCTSIKRTGISPMKISANIIARNESLGISTSENPDGTPNVVNQFVYNVVDAPNPEYCAVNELFVNKTGSFIPIGLCFVNSSKFFPA